MRARIWGCRGSLATPGEETLRFGGNTSCLEVELGDGTLVVLDAGTGIRALGLQLARERAARTIHLCLTHLHLDHIEGLGFFTPLWQPDTCIHVWGPASPTRALRDRVARYFSPPLFPMQLSDVPSDLSFHDVPDGGWEIGSARVTAQTVSHPGPTVGYRLEEDGQSLAYIPDHEPALGVSLASLSPDWVSGFGLAQGVGVLVHDCQYSEAEYETKTGWGHSSVADAVTYARMAGAEQLIMFHHDPLHDDEQLEQLRDRACELSHDGSAEPQLAAEGMELEL